MVVKKIHDGDDPNSEAKKKEMFLNTGNEAQTFLIVRISELNAGAFLGLAGLNNNFLF